ncbi:hypothetical protein ACIQNI_25560 [Streptomyces sp. NPDC091266]|uniref:hypothetical protein n=1 Tax=Streptomyces sp. NPDC091266 TaxID=3365978 RepID=UPI003827CB87
MTGARTARLLPWATPDGKTCLLVGDGTGFLSRVADGVESVQLGMAEELLGHAADMLDDRKATAEELRFLGRRLVEALREVCRVAENRALGGSEPATMEEIRIMNTSRTADDGKHAGRPSDKEWTPPPTPPSPDGNGSGGK